MFPLARIMQKKSQKTLHVQEFSSTEKYLVGSYDVEVFDFAKNLFNYTGQTE